MKLFRTKVGEDILPVAKRERYPTNKETIDFMVNCAIPITGEFYLYNFMRKNPFMAEEDKLNGFGKGLYWTVEGLKVLNAAAITYAAFLR